MHYRSCGLLFSLRRAGSEASPPLPNVVVPSLSSRPLLLDEFFQYPTFSWHLSFSAGLNFRLPFKVSLRWPQWYQMRFLREQLNIVFMMVHASFWFVVRIETVTDSRSTVYQLFILCTRIIFHGTINNGCDIVENCLPVLVRS